MRTPILQSQAISKEPLIVRTWLHAGLGPIVRSDGKRILRVNGVPVRDAHSLREGDTVEVDRQIMLLCTKRPLELPALRFATIDMPFGAPDADGIIGESPHALQLREDIARTARLPGHALISGDSGTGKELAARAFHRVQRLMGAFVPQNAASISPGLIDAELYGNAKNYPGDAGATNESSGRAGGSRCVSRWKRL